MLAVEFAAEGIVVIGVLLAALSSAVALLFRSLQASNAEQLKDKDKQIQYIIEDKDKQIKSTEVERDGYKKLLESATSDLERIIEKGLVRLGLVPVPRLVPVEPKHSSPATETQVADADYVTLQARQTAASLALKRLEAEVDALPPDATMSLKRLEDDVGGAPVIKKVAEIAVEAVAKKLEEVADKEGAPTSDAGRVSEIAVKAVAEKLKEVAEVVAEKLTEVTDEEKES